MVRLHRSVILAALLTSLVLVAHVSVADAQQVEGVIRLPSADKVDRLAGWKSYHQNGATTEDVWSVDKEGVVHCKGTPLGYLYTERDYANFVLELDYRWPPGEQAGKGGILIRKTGPDQVWPKSLEAQINAGDAGDFWGLVGYTLDGPEDRKKTLEHPQFGKLTNLKKLAMVERPTGQWNHYKVIADGTNVTLEVNGQVVNRATSCDATPGKVLLTAEGFPIQFRNLHLSCKDE